MGSRSSTMLRPGCCIVFDDLTWQMDDRWPDAPIEQRELAQVTEVFELLVSQHPGYDMIETDGEWGSAPNLRPQHRASGRS